MDFSNGVTFEEDHNGHHNGNASDVPATAFAATAAAVADGGSDADTTMHVSPSKAPVRLTLVSNAVCAVVVVTDS